MDYENKMREIDFTYTDLEDLVEKVLKTNFRGISNYWDEFRSEAPLVFLNCLKYYKEDKEKGEFGNYLYKSLVMRFLNMYAQFEGGCSRYSVYKNQHRKRVDLEDYAEPVAEVSLDDFADLMKEVNDYLNFGDVSPRDREIFEYFFGINGRAKKTSGEIGRIYGLTYRRVDQIKNEVIEKVRKELKNREVNVPV